MLFLGILCSCQMEEGQEGKKEGDEKEVEGGRKNAACVVFIICHPQCLAHT